MLAAEARAVHAAGITSRWCSFGGADLSGTALRDAGTFKLDRNRDGDPGSDAHRAPDTHRSTVQLGQRLHQRQSQSRSLVRCGRRFADLKERRAEAGKLIGRNTGTGVLHIQFA